MITDNITLSRASLIDMLTMAAEAGAEKVLARIHPANDRISQAEAFRIYGRRAVEMWLADGLLTYRRNGTSTNSKKWFSRAELNAISAMESAPIVVKTKQTR